MNAPGPTCRDIIEPSPPQPVPACCAAAVSLAGEATNEPGRRSGNRVRWNGVGGCGVIELDGNQMCQKREVF